MAIKKQTKKKVYLYFSITISCYVRSQTSAVSYVNLQGRKEKKEQNIKLMHRDVFMLLVPALFWHGSGKDRKVQWQCVREVSTGETTVCVWFVLTSQVKQVSSDGKQFNCHSWASSSNNLTNINIILVLIKQPLMFIIVSFVLRRSMF